MIGIVDYGPFLTLQMTKCNIRRDTITSDDGVDYLYTQTTADVICVFSPSATSYATLEGSTPKSGRANAGRTDRILFDYLSNPSNTDGSRKILKMWTFDADMGAQVVYLLSPNPGTTSDAKNGPICKVVTMQEVHGSKTWVMHLQFVTWINNCMDNQSPIISHRWERNVDYDAQYRAIVVTNGKVVFNVGRLWNATQSADFYRNQLFQAPPDNFSRQHINVNLGSDNCSIDYTVVDGETFYNLGPNSPAVKCEARLMTWYDEGSMTSAVARAAPTIGENISPPVIGSDPNRFGLWRRGSNIVGALTSEGVQELPKYRANIHVRVIGARDSARADLYQLAQGIAFSRLGPPGFWLLANRSEMIVHQDLTDNVVELDWSLRWMDQKLAQLAGVAGPLAAGATIAALILGNDSGRAWMQSYFPNKTLQNPTGNNTYQRQLVAGVVVDGVGSTLASFPTVGAAAIEALGVASVAAAVNQIRALVGGGGVDETKPLLDQNFGPLIDGGESRQQFRSNRPMNIVPAFTNDRFSRSVGYMKYLVTAGLLGQCVIPPRPGPPLATAKWDSNATTVPIVISGGITGNLPGPVGRASQSDPYAHNGTAQVEPRPVVVLERVGGAG